MTDCIIKPEVGGCRGSIALTSDGKTLSHRAVTRGATACVRLRLPRLLGCTDVLLRFRRENGGEEFCLPLGWEGLSGGDDLYAGLLSTAEMPGEGGLWFFRAEISCAAGALCGSRAARQDGEDSGARDGMVFAPLDAGSPFSYQLTVSEFAHPAPAWIYGGIIYQIFIDRFSPGGSVTCKAGAVKNDDWDNGIPQYPAYPGAPLKNNEFFGGTLWGIADRLDYIASLGVTCLYLSPVFEARSNHKYDTGDYLRIDEMFGGEAAFDHLIAEAKTRGIRVILDGVFNHTGDDSRYFNRYGTYPTVGAYQSTESPYYDWYRFQQYPDKYTCWWGIDILPRIHPEAESCRRFFLDEKDGVIAHWAKRGIGGMRLDVADELDDGFIAGIKQRLCESCPDAVLYGEVWEDASNKVAYDRRRTYYLGRELDGVMNYPLRSGLIDYLRNGTTEGLRYALGEIYENAPARIANAQMNLLGSHDTARILTALAGPLPDGHSNDELAQMRLSAEEYERGRQLLALGYLALATLPGVPVIYYGDEVGMQGYSDPFNRRPFPWNKTDERLLSAYREIGMLRRTHRVYGEGEFALLRLSSDCMMFSRRDEEAEYVTVIHRGSNPCILTARHSFRVLYRTDGKEAARGKKLILPPVFGAVLRLEKGDCPQLQ